MGFRLEGLVSAATIVGVLLVSEPTAIASEESELKASILNLAVSNADADAKLIAIGLSTHTQLTVEDMNVDLLWAGLTDSPISLVRQQKADLALIDPGDAALSGLDDDVDLRSVVKLWVRNGSGDDADDPGKLLLASSSVRSDSVETLLTALFSDPDRITLARIDSDRLDPFIAFDSGLLVARHPGVDDYLKATDKATAADNAPVYETIALANSEPHRPMLAPPREAKPHHSPIPRPPGIVNGRSFTLYFNSNETVLTKDDFKAVSAACNYAATLPRARFVIAGHTDTVGSMTYNEGIAEGRATSVAEAIRNDPRFREVLSVVEYGERNLAVPTGDDIAEPLNRRVDITVFPDDQ